MPSRHRLTALPGRLDKSLSALAPELSRTRLSALIKSGEVTVNGKAVTRAAHVLKGGENLEFSVPEARPAQPAARQIPLEIVYEDKHLLVINKPAGLVVHPAAGHADDTLVNALLAHCGKSLSGIGGEARPGIVHRLDKDTSGLLVVAKNDAAHQGLAKQFSARAVVHEPSGEGTERMAQKEISRIYIAFSWGLPKQAKGTIDAALGRAVGNRKKMAIVHAM
ncbi:MAG: RluA family pseudouridine synthase, partial [Proteobacteria bacterium]|nr:RluA family pseudouridine synthase [Pseudomonadota bacterium]